MEPAAPAPLFALVGRRGAEIPLAPLEARLGKKALAAVLRALTVTERVHPGRPRGAPAAVRKAFRVEFRRGVLSLPRGRAALLAGLRTPARLPFLDGLRAAPGGGANAPLPPPRRLPAGQLGLARPLYAYQAAAVDFLCGPGGPLGPEAVAALGGAAYLQMDPGLGKTGTAAGVIARLGVPALAVAPTDAIACQWVEELGVVLPGLRVAIFRNPPKGSRRPPPCAATHDVVVVIINTFHSKPPEFLEGFGLLILDEAHEYQSEKHGLALWLAQTPAVLGLSATPEARPDGLDRLVSLHLGRPILPASIPGFDAGGVRFRGAVRHVKYSGDPAFARTVAGPAGMMSAILTVGALIRDPARLALVAGEIERLFHAHLGPDAASLGLGPRPAADATPKFPEGGLRRHGIFVFAEHRDFLLVLRDALLARRRLAAADVVVAADGEDGGDGGAGDAEDGGGEAGAAGAGAAGAEDPADRTTVLRGGVARDAVGAARSLGAHVVFTTYGYSRRGISLPDMTALVLATPRRNGLTQILGRILRRGSDESIVRQVVDVDDVATGLHGQVFERKKIYRENGFPVSAWAADWADFAGAPGAGAPGAEAEALRALPLEELLDLADE